MKTRMNPTERREAFYEVMKRFNDSYGTDLEAATSIVEMLGARPWLAELTGQAIGSHASAALAKAGR
jgi:hypothetical protein